MAIQEKFKLYNSNNNNISNNNKRVRHKSRTGGGLYRLEKLSLRKFNALCAMPIWHRNDVTFDRINYKDHSEKLPISQKFQSIDIKIYSKFLR